jgi:hypothetical protein
VLIRPAVAEQLLEHGIRPREQTRPELVRELLNSWYVFEIREARIRRGELERALGAQPPEHYSARIHELRRRYKLLSLPVQRWYNQRSSSSLGS